MHEYFVGLMSGTSLDGIDAALVAFADERPQLVAFHYQAFDATLRQRIQAISQPEQPVLLHDYGTLDSELGSHFGEATLELLQQAGVSASAVRAIGSHGQTVFHAPQGEHRFSLQIGDPNRIAQLTGITTVADFRRRDLAVGGQGAPLVPAFHQAIFADAEVPRCIVNIGGIANVTILGKGPVIGFDTGPGNGLMDFWIQQQRGLPFDADGVWAASGQVHAGLLNSLMDDPYFQLAPPKSTGKEYFSQAWLNRQLAQFQAIAAVDVQATLCRCTAQSIIDAVRRHAPDTRQLVICGGGAHNQRLLGDLTLLWDGEVLSSTAFGIDPDHVEAMAFAWLARRTLQQLPGNLCSVTGAAVPVVLGGIYPGTVLGA